METKELLTLIGFGFISWLFSLGIRILAPMIMPDAYIIILNAVFVPMVAFFLAIGYYAMYKDSFAMVSALIFTVSILVLDMIIYSTILGYGFGIYASLMKSWIPYLIVFIAIFLAGDMAGKENQAF